MSGNETISQVDEPRRGAAPEPVPGIVLVFSDVQPQLAAAPIGRGTVLELGRDSVLGLELSDARMSRRHAAVVFAAGRFTVRDLDSRNGTFVDGERVTGELDTGDCVLRVGDTVLLLRQDVRPFVRGAIDRSDGIVIGPSLRPVWDVIASAAATESCLHIRGETGTGKELAARRFHQASGRGKGPFSAINCATIPSALAERLLFGARKGAFSGADVDADGYIHAAHGGTLFLDEVADLDLVVQAKLLRVLEERAVLPLGGIKPVPIDIRVCSATHRDLADEVARGRFRSDLYYRLGLPAVDLPPLRARAEDIPCLMQVIAARAPGALPVHASIVEAVLTRPWPGNVRELDKRVTEAARAAQLAGDTAIRAAHLAAAAGQASARSLDVDAATPMSGISPIAAALTREDIERALAQTSGNVTAAAVALGLHRTQLRRLMVHLKIRRPTSGTDSGDGT